MDELEKGLTGSLNKGALHALGSEVKQAFQSDQYRQMIAARVERERQVVEEADWIGTTGLPEEQERELPRYLRREFGQSLFDEDALKAADLYYLGSVQEAALLIHYWHIAYDCGGEPCYAYIEIDPHGRSCSGWGDRRAPERLLATHDQTED